jgi:hypothetical protein
MPCKPLNNLRGLVLGLLLSVSLSAIPIRAAPGPTALPQIDSLSPSTGPIGTQVIVHGAGFSSAQNIVLFDDSGAIAFLVSNDGTTITFTVPAHLTPYCFYSTPPCGVPQMNVELKQYRITVANDGGVSNSLTFTVTKGLYLPLVISAASA